MEIIRIVELRRLQVARRSAAPVSCAVHMAFSRRGQHVWVDELLKGCANPIVVGFRGWQQTLWKGGGDPVDLMSQSCRFWSLGIMGVFKDSR
jgi:hypothetical protein